MRNVLLLSGGIDSSAVAAWLRPDGAIVIDYGQLPAKGEIRSAKAVAEALGIPLFVIKADCSSVGSGIMTGQEPLPLSPSQEWWPFRNQLLITLAGSWAVQKGASELILGSVKGDERHSDGTPEFYNCIDALVSMQEGKLRVTAPAIEMTSAELIKASKITDDILGWTHSCHECDWACGSCPGCIRHMRVIAELGI